MCNRIITHWLCDNFRLEIHTETSTCHHHYYHHHHHYTHSHTYTYTELLHCYAQKLCLLRFFVSWCVVYIPCFFLLSAIFFCFNLMNELAIIYASTIIFFICTQFRPKHLYSWFYGTHTQKTMHMKRNFAMHICEHNISLLLVSANVLLSIFFPWMHLSVAAVRRSSHLWIKMKATANLWCLWWILRPHRIFTTLSAVVPIFGIGCVSVDNGYSARARVLENWWRRRWTFAGGLDTCNNLWDFRLIWDASFWLDIEEIYLTYFCYDLVNEWSFIVEPSIS